MLDLATRKGVGGSMREHMRAELTGAALTMAIQRQQPPSGLLQHADRGSQHAADDYRRLLTAAGMRQSMRRRGNCLDNASMESFFHTLKVELAQQRRGATRDDARCDVFAYIEGSYNRQLIHSALATGPQSRWSTVPPDPRPSNQEKIREVAGSGAIRPASPSSLSPATATQLGNAACSVCTSPEEATPGGCPAAKAVRLPQSQMDLHSLF